jgi:hypothetical protein
MIYCDTGMFDTPFTIGDSVELMRMPTQVDVECRHKADTLLVVATRLAVHEMKKFVISHRCLIKHQGSIDSYAFVTYDFRSKFLLPLPDQSKDPST